MEPSFQLNIPNPCQQKWETFTPTADGGWCASCRKNVIDFSQMTESQLVAFFRDRLKTEENICGRFRNEQLNKNYSIEEWFPAWSEQKGCLVCEIPVEVLQKHKDTRIIRLPQIHQTKLARRVAVAILTFFCIEEGTAQGRLVSGKVTDSETGESIPYVSISIKGSKRGTRTDTSGRYQIAVNDHDTLLFSFIGYETTQQKVHKSTNTLDTELNVAVMGLSEITVKGEAPDIKHVISGGLSIIQTRYGIQEDDNFRKCSTGITLLGNAVRNDEVLIVPQLTTAGNFQQQATDKGWFQENGFQEVKSLQIYDYTGKVYAESFLKVNAGMIKVDVKTLPPGAYILRVVYRNERSITEYEVSTIRILIER